MEFSINQIQESCVEKRGKSSDQMILKKRKNFSPQN